VLTLAQRLRVNRAGRDDKDCDEGWEKAIVKREARGLPFSKCHVFMDLTHPKTYSNSSDYYYYLLLFFSVIIEMTCNHNNQAVEIMQRFFEFICKEVDGIK